jgi:cyanate permease
MRGSAALGVVGLLGLFYYWLIEFGTRQPELGNGFLAMLFPALSLGAYLMLVGIGVPGRLFWRRYGFIAMLWVIVMSGLHTVGSFMPTPESQRWFLFAPLGLIALVSVLAFLRWLIELSRDKYDRP